MTIASMATLAYTDVSHLKLYNEHTHAPTEMDVYTRKMLSGSNSHIQGQEQTQPQYHTQVESIKASVPIASFSIPHNIDQRHLNVQATGGYNYNGDVHQQYTGPLLQRSYSAPAQIPSQQLYSAAPHASGLAPSPSPNPIQNSYAAPAPIEQSFLAPASPHIEHRYAAPRQQYSAPIATPVDHQFYSAPDPTPVQQQSYSAPLPAPVHQNYLPPIHQQQTYLAPTANLVRQQTNYGPAQVPQQRYASPAPVQYQQIYSSNTQLQEQSNEGTQLHQQQSTFGVVGNAASSIPAPVRQSYSAPVHQPYSPHAHAQQQSYLSSGEEESGSYNYQPSLPVQQSYSAPAPLQQSSSAVASASFQKTYSTPASAQTDVTAPQQHSLYSALSSVNQQGYSPADSASYNNQPSAPVQQFYSSSSPVQQFYSTSAPVSQPVQQSYTAPAPSQLQKTYSAPAPTQIQQSHSGPALVHQQSYPLPSEIKFGSYNYQLPAPAQQYQSPAALAPVQSYSPAPAERPLQQPHSTHAPSPSTRH